MKTQDNIRSSSEESRSNYQRYYFRVANGNFKSIENKQFIVPWQLNDPFAGKGIGKSF